MEHKIDRAEDLLEFDFRDLGKSIDIELIRDMILTTGILDNNTRLRALTKLYNMLIVKEITLN